MTLGELFKIMVSKRRQVRSMSACVVRIAAAGAVRGT